MKTPRLTTRLLFSGLILLIAVGITTLIFLSEPTAVRSGATKKTAMLVEVTSVEKGTFRPLIVAMGTMKPARDIILRPRVNGEVVEISENFTPGGFVEKGEVLVRLDPSDYENRLKQRQSELKQALADLDLEMGLQEVARKEYQLFEESISSENTKLVLRRPQLESARAKVESARTSVKQANLELDRTTIKSPFKAHILSRNVNLGSQVSAGDELGRLVGWQTYWLEATVPVSKLHRLSFPAQTVKEASEVIIRNRSAWPEGVYRKGRLFRLIGSLEEQTRLARVLITVNDPLAHTESSSGLPALMIGAFVEAQIQADAIPDVIKLDRDYVRKDDTVWVMQDGELKIRKADIVFRDSEHAYIKSGLQESDKVVVTNLATVVEGAKLRLKKANSADQSSKETVPAKGADASSGRAH